MSNEVKVIANEDDFLLNVESELKYDSLYNLLIEREQLKKELFQEEFLSALEKDIHRWYSVADAGRVIGGEKPIPPSSLTYYIDSLAEYIIPEDAPSNKYIRLNYLSLIKLKMVWLLKDEFRLNGLKAELGITGNPKNVITNPNEISHEEDLKEMKEKLDRFEAMNEMLWGLLVEKGEDNIPRLKKPLQSLLTSETMLLEEKTSILDQLENQKTFIEKLVVENKQLKERIDLTEKQSSSFNKKLEEKEGEHERIIEGEKKLNYLTETLRARQQAEKEWEKLGILRKIKGKKSEFVTERVDQILRDLNIDKIE